MKNNRGVPATFWRQNCTKTQNSFCHWEQTNLSSSFQKLMLNLKAFSVKQLISCLFNAIWTNIYKNYEYLPDSLLIKKSLPNHRTFGRFWWCVAIPLFFISVHLGIKIIEDSVNKKKFEKVVITLHLPGCGTSQATTIQTTTAPFSIIPGIYLFLIPGPSCCLYKKIFN